VDREAFELVRRKHDAYASWAIWAEPTGRPKSNVGDLSVLDPDQNPTLLQTVQNGVVMVGLNLSRFFPVPFGNFHDSNPEAQDYKIRYAFTDTPYYGAYMTDLVKDVVMLNARDLMRHLASNPSLLSQNVQRLLEEFGDLGSTAPTLITFGCDAHQLVARHVSPNRYTRLIGVTHYSQYISKEKYRERVLAELAASRWQPAVLAKCQERAALSPHLPGEAATVEGQRQRRR